MEIVQAIMNDAVNAEKEILALKAQRDELLAVLRDVIGWVPGREHWHTDSPMKSVERARALIAKHKEASHG